MNSFSTWPEKNVEFTRNYLFLPLCFSNSNHSFFSYLRAKSLKGISSFFLLVWFSNQIESFSIFSRKKNTARGRSIIFENFFVKWCRSKLTLLVEVINYHNYHDVFPVLLKRETKNELFEYRSIFLYNFQNLEKNWFIVLNAKIECILKKRGLFLTQSWS